MCKEYIKSFSLSKNKPFQWRIDENSSIEIKRDFKNIKGIKTLFTRDELDRINSYMSKDKYLPLANSVSKLADGTEKDGIGSFIYKNIDPDTTKAQASSQLCAIFVGAGVWEDNGRKSSMEFIRKSDDWAMPVKAYYERL